MGVMIGVVGGQGSFLPLFRLHPGVNKVFVTDHQPSRMDRAASHYKLDATLRVGRLGTETRPATGV